MKVISFMQKFERQDKPQHRKGMRKERSRKKNMSKGQWTANRDYFECNGKANDRVPPTQTFPSKGRWVSHSLLKVTVLCLLSTVNWTRYVPVAKQTSSQG
jgi:hypothetical protein